MSLKFGKHTINLYGMGAILLGAFLLIEHIYSYGRLDFFDFFGHEWFGFLLILAGIVANLNFKKKGVTSS